MNNGFSDREVIEVAKKVNVVHDEESESIYPTTRLGKVSLETKDGEKYSAKVFHPRGSPENPLSRQELEDKFLGLASTVLSRDRAKELLHAVRNLEQLKDINELAELTATGGRARWSDYARQCSIRSNSSNRSKRFERLKRLERFELSGRPPLWQIQCSDFC